MGFDVKGLDISEYTLVAAVPSALTLLFVSDLHDCDNVPVLEVARRLQPDAVVVSGDFIHNAEVYRRGLEFLQAAAQCYPVFCSLGNHEKRFNGDLHSLVEETGAVLLDNAAVSFGGLHIGGLSSGYDFGEAQGNLRSTPIPDVKWLQQFSALEGYKLLLSHHPEYYPKYIRRTTVNLTLSGHAHGGQWRFFGRGVFAPGQGVFPRYTGGLYEGRLIVSRGLGNQHSVPRINNRPEVVVIHLLPSINNTITNSTD